VPDNKPPSEAIAIEAGEKVCMKRSISESDSCSRV
jgi:hypothetical protein